MSKPKVLYAIQGTGNGHVARAREVIPILKKFADVDILISGNQSEIALPEIPKFSFRGVTMAYNEKGGVSYSKSLRVNNLFSALKEIYSLPVKDYNLVISDFEFVSAWACKLKGMPCLAVSHQSAMVSKHVPQPLERSIVGRLILKYYAPATNSIGFHFNAYDGDIYKPIIRKEIRELKIEKETEKLYSVYLPSYSAEKLVKVFQKFEDFTFVVFSKDAKEARVEGNVIVEPIENKRFIATLKACEGVLTGAGFETPAEVLYLNKKLLVIPIAKQYEQLMNAKALEELGVAVLYDLEEASILKVGKWLKAQNRIQVDFPDETEDIIKNKVMPFAR